MRIDLPVDDIVLEYPDSLYPPAPSSLELAGLMDVRPGESVLELGCGTGLLSVVAAKLGARSVVAADVDARALEVTAHNARINGVSEQIKTLHGSWYEALKQDKNRQEAFQVIIATPPQTPGPAPFGPRYGGRDGLDMMREIIAGAPAFLDPLRGRLWLLAISLANPAALIRHLKTNFSSIIVVHESTRPFTSGEYDALSSGLFDYLSELRRAGESEFLDCGDDRYAFRNRFIRASGHGAS